MPLIPILWMMIGAVGTAAVGGSESAEPETVEHVKVPVSAGDSVIDTVSNMPVGYMIAGAIGVGVVGALLVKGK